MCINGNEVHAVVGHNGSGKTTLLKIVAGLIKPSKGRVEVFTSKNEMFFLPDKLPFPGFLKIKELAELVADMYGVELNLEYFKVTGTEGLLDRKFETLSSGEKRRCGFALAFMVNPKLLILDEPFEGIDIDTRRAIREYIKAIRSRTAVLVSIHEAIPYILDLANTITIMKNGKIIGTYSSSELGELIDEASKADPLISPRSLDLTHLYHVVENYSLKKLRG